MFEIFSCIENFSPQGNSHSDEYTLLWSRDDEEIRSVFNYRRYRSHAKWILVIVIATIAILITVFTVWWLLTRNLEWNRVEYEKLTATFQRAAIVTNAIPCASLGKNILKKGGNAVDAMITSILCDGLTMPQSMGIGGGFFMIIYNKTHNNFTTIDSREKAPAAASWNMYSSNPNASAIGVLSAGVPGEVKGLWTVYKKFGSGLPWEDLVMPAVDLCEQGIPISAPLAKYLLLYRNMIMKNPEFKRLFVDSNGNVMKEGDKYTNLKLCATLRTIAKEGGNYFYEGKIATNLVKDIREAGGLITEEDLRLYQPVIEKPFVAHFGKGNFTLHSLQPPASGAVLAYILRLLSEMLPAPNELITAQRMTESFKYAYAARGELGDRFYMNVTPITDKILSDEFIRQVRSKISDSRTWNDTEHYNMNSISPDDGGTANLAVFSESGDAVVATSTINLVFGSKFISKSTGILLNDEMNDFVIPSKKNFDLSQWSTSNLIEPGKRPMSSMCPSIITDSSGNVKLLIGGAGGKTITTAVAIAISRTILLKENIRTALDNILYHHQLIPMVWQYYNNTPKDIIEGMRKIGHNVRLNPVTSFSAVSAIEVDEFNLYGNCDRRRPGQVDGY